MKYFSLILIKHKMHVNLTSAARTETDHPETGPLAQSNRDLTGTPPPGDEVNTTRFT